MHSTDDELFRNKDPTYLIRGCYCVSRVQSIWNSSSEGRNSRKWGGREGKWDVQYQCDYSSVCRWLIALCNLHCICTTWFVPNSDRSLLWEDDSWSEQTSNFLLHYYRKWKILRNESIKISLTFNFALLYQIILLRCWQEGEEEFNGWYESYGKRRGSPFKISPASYTDWRKHHYAGISRYRGSNLR